MEDSMNVTYDDLVQTRNVQMLKSVVPFLDFSTQKTFAMLIQFLEFRNASEAFSKRDNSMAACALPNGPDRRNAMLTAIRQYCTPKEQETIDTILNLFCVMDNYEMLNNL
jgi:hypothetical protein